jgi:hypothetical protein
MSAVATLLQVLTIGPVIGRAGRKKIRLLAVQFGVQPLGVVPNQPVCQARSGLRVYLSCWAAHHLDGQAPGTADLGRPQATPGSSASNDGILVLSAFLIGAKTTHIGT